MVGERWGSLKSFASNLTTLKAAPKFAHRDAARERERGGGDAERGGGEFKRETVGGEWEVSRRGGERGGKRGGLDGHRGREMGGMSREGRGDEKGRQRVGEKKEKYGSDEMEMRGGGNGGDGNHRKEGREGGEEWEGRSMGESREYLRDVGMRGRMRAPSGDSFTWRRGGKREGERERERGGGKGERKMAGMVVEERGMGLGGRDVDQP